MIKVPARNKFSQNSTIKSKKNQSKIHESTKTLAMVGNGQKIHDFDQYFSSSKSCQHDKQISSNPHIRKSTINFFKNDDIDLIKQTKHRKNLSMKSPSCLKKHLQNRNSQNYQIPHFKDEGFDTIKIEHNEIQQTQRKHRKSKTLVQNQTILRSSAVKKTSNIAKRSQSKKSNLLAKKVSIFDGGYETVVNQSQHYEDFLKQSNVSQKPKTKQIVNQFHKFHENKENRFVLTQSHTKSYFQRENFVKFHEESKNPIKKTGRVSKEFLFVKSPKVHQVSSNNQESEIKTDQQNINDLFKNFAQEDNKTDQLKSNEKQLNQVLKNDETQQYVKKQEALRKAENERISLQMKQKQETQQLFRRLTRQIASKQQMQKFEKKSQNFYEDLRVKMLKKYDMMMKDYRLDDKEKQKIGLLIEGCNLERHRRVSNFKSEKKMMAINRRPETAKAIRQASKDIYRLNYIENKKGTCKMRPSSCHPKSSKQNSSFDKISCIIQENVSNSSKLEYKKESLVNFSYDQSKSQCDVFFSMTSPYFKTLQTFKAENQSTDQIIYSRGQFSSSNLTLTRKKTNKKSVQQKSLLKNKFNKLLDICDIQSGQHVETKKKMKVFEYYCSKIDNGFQKMSKKINNFVSDY